MPLIGHQSEELEIIGGERSKTNQTNNSLLSNKTVFFFPVKEEVENS